MKYFVTVSGHEHQVDISRGPDGSHRASVAGRELPLDVVAFGPREFSLRVGQRVLDLTIEGSPPALGVIASGLRTYIEVESERMRMASRARRTDDGGAEREIRSPMPGRVVKLMAAVGEEVTAGQPVVIVEAMKMENEVKARRDGTVQSVLVKEGVTVEAGAVLVTLGQRVN